MAMDAIDVFRVGLISGGTALFLTDSELSFMYISFLLTMYFIRIIIVVEILKHFDPIFLLEMVLFEKCLHIIII